MRAAREKVKRSQPESAAFPPFMARLQLLLRRPGGGEEYRWPVPARARESRYRSPGYVIVLGFQRGEELRRGGSSSTAHNATSDALYASILAAEHR